MAFFLVKIHQWRSQSFPTHPPIKTWPAVQCSFNSASDPFNGQTTNSISKAPKVIESRTLKIQSGDLLKQHCSIQLVKSAPIPLGLRKRDGLFRSLIENNLLLMTQGAMTLQDFSQLLCKGSVGILLITNPRWSKNSSYFIITNFHLFIGLGDTPNVRLFAFRCN